VNAEKNKIKTLLSELDSMIEYLVLDMGEHDSDSIEKMKKVYRENQIDKVRTKIFS
jgi:hypothetical protein